MKSVNKSTNVFAAIGGIFALAFCLSACAPAATGTCLVSTDKSNLVAPDDMAAALRGEQSAVRFVYGYTDGSAKAAKSLCMKMIDDPSDKENYAVVICQEETALSFAALKASTKELKNFVPDESTKRRLAKIAVAELIPPPVPVSTM